MAQPDAPEKATALGSFRRALVHFLPALSKRDPCQCHAVLTSLSGMCTKAVAKIVPSQPSRELGRKAFAEDHNLLLKLRPVARSHESQTQLLMQSNPPWLKGANPFWCQKLAVVVGALFLPFGQRGKQIRNVIAFADPVKYLSSGRCKKERTSPQVAAT